MLLALLFAIQAHALGPIPNGTYQGTETCARAPAQQSTIVVTDTTMEWGGQKNSFIADENGFFELKTLAGQNGNGLGHFTKDGLHYEARFEFKNGARTYWAPGEDTFTYRDGKLFLRSSASAGPRGMFVCEGTFGK